MSYILDALRKADAQRERSPARGIHAQPALAPVRDEAGDRASRLIWLAAGAVAGAALIALIGWWLSGPDAVSPPVPVASQPMAPAPAPTVAATPPSPASPAPASAPAPASEVLPAAPPPRPAPQAAPPVEFGNVPKPAGTAAAGSPAGQANDRLLSAAELPPEVLRDLPKLTITGGVYSTNPALRMLIVNGLVLNEGAEAAPGVMLAQIRPKVAVLTFRGWRYGVTY